MSTYSASARTGLGNVASCKVLAPNSTQVCQSSQPSCLDRVNYFGLILQFYKVHD